MSVLINFLNNTNIFLTKPIYVCRAWNKGQMDRVVKESPDPGAKSKRRVKMYYLHTTPGRLRIKIPQIKNKPRKGKKIEDLFRNRNGMENVAVNLLTGSVLFEFDEENVDSSDILAVLKKNRMFDETKVTGSNAVIEGTTDRIGKTFGKAVFSWAVGSFLEESGLSFLAILI